MAKKRKIRYLQMTDSLALGALAVGDVISEAFGQTVNNRVYALYAKGVWSIDQVTPGESPIMVGFSHGDYSSAEVEECLEANAQWDQGDKVAQEQGARKVRRATQFSGLTAEEVAEDGAKVFTRLGFYIEDGETLALWARNSGAAILTAGSVFRFSGIIAVVDR